MIVLVVVLVLVLDYDNECEDEHDVNPTKNPSFEGCREE